MNIILTFYFCVEIFVVFGAEITGDDVPVDETPKQADPLRLTNVKGKMFMKKMSTSDLASSASGYIYRQDGNGPGKLVKIVEEPKSSSSAYYSEYSAPLIGPYGTHADIHHAFEGINHGYGLVGGDSGINLPYKYSDYDGAADYPGGYGLSGKYVGGDDSYNDGYGVAKYVKSGGNDYNSGYYADEGEKGDKGHKNSEDYEKGEVGHYDKGEDGGHYSDEGGHKKGYYDEGEKYASNDQGKKGYEAASYGHSGGHKKGHKTTGYHNVYHKDEYKKEHTFYDDANESGHKSNHGGYEENQASAEGGYKKGGHLDSGFNAADYANKGDYAKGHHNNFVKGYKGDEGHDGYYGNQESYANKGGNSGGKVYGYLNGPGYGKY